MCSDIAVEAINLSKCYQIYSKPQDRLKQTLWRGRKQFYQSFFALRDVSFELKRGDVLGIIGLNGAGKSTLLQLVCGTLTPSSGNVHVNGRVSALLELGSGFHHEFTGRENVYMNASILGLSKEEIDARFDSIARFADIGDFIEQPVKVYSSGMLMRLAFAVAVNVDPDILIIDEALSVGDGTFSRKSFDRIMALKEAGKTILFCSHSTYQVETMSNQVIWLDRGEMRMHGRPDQVVLSYTDFLKCQAKETGQHRLAENSGINVPSVTESRKDAFISGITVAADDITGDNLTVYSRQTSLEIQVRFSSSPELPTPTIGIGFTGEDGRMVSSCSTYFDGISIEQDSVSGDGQAIVVFPKLPLLRGLYRINVYLMCEKGLLIYDMVMRAAQLVVVQEGLELGVVSLEHAWNKPGKSA